MKNYLILNLILCFTFSLSYASKRYVTPSGTGNYSGSSWGNASNNLQAMINNSSSGDEVWVKYGTYYPNSYPNDCSGCSTTRDYTFFMKNGVSVIGQFAGTESTISQRVLGAGQSILSGDLTNDGLTFNNAYHVVTFVNSYTRPLLDGFTIQNGNADVNSTITAFNSTYPQTYSRNWGGGILAVGSAQTIVNCHILNNYATYGGGMLNSTTSNTAVNNSIFVYNSANEGAAIYNHDNSPTSLTYITIANNNAAVAGGAIYNFNTPNPQILNSIIWANSSSSFSGIANNGSTPTVIKSIVQNGYTPCSNCPNTNGNTDPLFKNIADPNGVDNIWGSADDGLELNLNSPAIEAAVGSVVTGTDLTGQTRHHDSPFRYNHPTNYSDIGAYENHNISPIIIYANESLTTGTNNGSSWVNAFRGSNALQNAITASFEGNEIWVRAGTYKPSAYPVGCTGCTTYRDYTFHLKDGVKMYGGFAGLETSISQRNLNTSETILSGDLNFIGISSDNVNHVIMSLNDRELTALDGFSIRDGGYYLSTALPAITTEFVTVNTDYGGGFYLKNTKINVHNVKFKSNQTKYGGGITIEGSYLPFFKGCVFEENSATYSGGAIYLADFGSMNFENCVFNANSSNTAGAVNNIYNDFNMINCVFTKNVSQNSGAAIYSTNSSPSFINSTFAGNITNNPTLGAILEFSSSSNPIIKNTIIWANTVGLGAIHADATSTPLISNSILQNGFSPCTSCPNTDGNINPKFALEIDADGLDNQWLTFDDGLAIIASSPAFNAGSNIDTPLLDIKGNPKFGVNKDIGAYAVQLPPSCLQNQLIAEKPLSSGMYSASVQMLSTANIPSANNVILQAAQQVILLPGFSAEGGAIFRAEIGPDCILIYE